MNESIAELAGNYGTGPSESPDVAHKLMGTVYLNGQFIPLERAAVSVMDRGFVFGEGIYEVVPNYGQGLFRLDEHIARLKNSLAAIGIDNPLADQAWEEISHRLVRDYGSRKMVVYLQVTRGVALARTHAIPRNLEPTIFAMACPLPVLPLNLAQVGVSAITSNDIRWLRCDIKTTALLANTLLIQQAHKRSAEEAILIRDGFAYEGASSNLFLVRNGVVTTPPTSSFLLAGITRQVVLDLLRDERIPTNEELVTEQALLTADEVWITSSTKRIMPVCRINDKPVGSGRPGPIWEAANAIFNGHTKEIA
jgi:D-alanine transaminase